MTDFINGLRHSANILEGKENCKSAYIKIMQEITKIELDYSIKSVYVTGQQGETK